MKLTQNTTIVITGASDGIGKAIALRFAQEGVNLALIGRDISRLDMVVTEARKIGANECRSYVCDIRNNNEIQETISLIKKDFSHIHILINNAGVWQKISQLDDIETSIIDDIISTNLSGVIHMTHATLPYLRAEDEAIIMNIVSKSGVVAQEGQSVYTATKYGIHGFTEVLKKDLKGSNIRVSGVYQSGTNTDMFRKTGDDFSTEKFTEPSVLADTIVHILQSPPKFWLHDIRVEY